MEKVVSIVDYLEEIFSEGLESVRAMVDIVVGFLQFMFESHELVARCL